MEKKIRLDITAAIKHHNFTKSKGKKMTIESLAKVVFKGENVSETTGENYLSRWNNGHRISSDSPSVKHCVKISEATGIAICDLIVIS
jgi:ribosomal protein L33